MMYWIADKKLSKINYNTRPDKKQQEILRSRERNSWIREQGSGNREQGSGTIGGRLVGARIHAPARIKRASAAVCQRKLGGERRLQRFEGPNRVRAASDQCLRAG